MTNTPSQVTTRRKDVKGGTRIGAILPQVEIGSDPGALRAYAQAVESLGFNHVLAYDHVLGVDREQRPEAWQFYDVDSNFHEPFVAYGFLAGVTTTLEFVTGIVILPQRQTALVAKQAAEVDVLSGGRLRLGIGLGWNAPEFEGLGLPFNNRGARMGEQIALLRELWTNRTVNFSGTYETVEGMGINPLPVQRPIPIWIGAVAPTALRRVGALGDGWLPGFHPGSGFEEGWATIADAAREAGRDPASIGVEGRVEFDHDISKVAEAIEAWRRAGVAYMAINTMNQDFESVDDHIQALSTVAELAGISRPAATA